MKNKHIINFMLGILFILFSSVTFAFSNKNSITVVCPRADAFRVFAFNLIQQGDHPGVWTFIQSHHSYNTPLHWKFSVMVDAANQTLAARKAKSALSHLRKIRGPEKVDKVWVCDYQGEDLLSAVAISVN